MIDKGGSVYKIRDTRTGLWSTGGYWSNSRTFSKAGKVWNGLGPLRNHLRAVARGDLELIPESWEVVEFVMAPALGGSHGVSARSIAAR